MVADFLPYLGLSLSWSVYLDIDFGNCYHFGKFSASWLKIDPYKKSHCYPVKLYKQSLNKVPEVG